MSEGEEILAKVYCQWLDLKHLYEVKENILLFFTALVNSKDNADCERQCRCTIHNFSFKIHWVSLENQSRGRLHREKQGSNIVVKTKTETSEMNRTEPIREKGEMVRALHFEKQLWSFLKYYF